MPPVAETVTNLERKFWQSLVDQDTATALDLLAEPAVMVSSHGAMKFDHAGYRKMAEQGSMVLTSYELSDVEVLCPNDTTAVVTYHARQAMAPRGQKGGKMEEKNYSSTWVQVDGAWKCVMHTETPADQPAPH
ncbi:nuclear transport factor 2 family protein [Ramlibacter sp. XY19]|uniref:nuclear transport factor 2 family protein n=1 Tax=Ramlibacter paludis TaxID=2908000 RepID=UPI0023DC9DB9|nr:nuclear transport factor 2 family protein [Ramlibacter paludis]MCG2591733.1 nuclear transport factor 2 family protein [Ramlibacter paludis]